MSDLRPPSSPEICTVCEVSLALTECDVTGCRFIASCADGVMVVDAAGIIRFVNHAAELLFDRAASELVGKPFGAPVLVGDSAELNLVHGNGVDIVTEMRSGAVEWRGTAAFLVTLRDITARKRAEEQIIADLQEKETLLKEIHHRVKNNLQVVSSLLNLQKDQVYDSRDGELLQECRNRIRSMALVHETLYRSADFTRVDFRNYLHTLLEELSRACLVNPGRIAVRLTGDTLRLGIDTAIPCGVMVNELVTNAIRHAFPDQRSGTIDVSLAREGDGIRISVADNGVGVPPGLDPAATSTLGLTLSSMLAAQIGGALEMVSTPDGTTFSVRFTEPD